MRIPFLSLSRGEYSAQSGNDGELNARGLLREVLYLWVVFLGLVTLFTLIMLLPAMAGPFQVFPKPAVSGSTGVIAKPGRASGRALARQNTAVAPAENVGLPQTATPETDIYVQVRDIDLTALSEDQFGDEELSPADTEAQQRAALTLPQ